MASKSLRVAPRLLSLAEAAAYCGVSSETFRRLCPVAAVDLGGSARLRKYDRVALDGWIDGLNDNVRKDGADEWINRMD